MNRTLKDKSPEIVLQFADITPRLPVAVRGFVREKIYKTGPWAQQSSPSGAGTLLIDHTHSRKSCPAGLQESFAVLVNEVQTNSRVYNVAQQAVDAMRGKVLNLSI